MTKTGVGDGSGVGVDHAGKPLKLRQMRKGTKSCMECRRRKIKCNYPPTPPSTPSVSTTPSTSSPSNASEPIIEKGQEKKCIECTTHNRPCQIQGFVATGSSPNASKAHVYTSQTTKPFHHAGSGSGSNDVTNATNNTAAVDSSNSQANQNAAPKARIYKRRRPTVNPDEASPEHSDGDERPRMKMHFDRMAPVVERIAKERRGGADRNNAISSNLPNQLQQQQAQGGTGGLDFAGSGTGMDDLGVNSGGAFANVLRYDLARTGLFDTQNNVYSNGFDSFLFAGTGVNGADALPYGPSTGTNTMSMASTSISLNPSRSSEAQPQPQRPISNILAKTSLNQAIGLTFDDESKNSSPLLSQLFNNEIFTQVTAATPQVLTEKVQMMSFSADVNKDATDSQKLLSTISSEPYLLDVLDISITWWIAWRDQAWALADVFIPADNGGQPSAEARVSCNPEQSPPGFVPLSNNKMRPSGCLTGGRQPYSSDLPIPLRDFVNLKLSRKDDPVSISTALLCIALSLRQLRTGIDDSALNISASTNEIAERLILAVDTVILSPSSNPSYTDDPGVLLLLMMRAKVFAEGNQLRKSWLSIRRAIEVARKIGFAELKTPLDAGEYARSVCPGELRKLFHRQRFMGSIMELDRLMSMVLGFPHAEDVKFTDRLALAVLTGQTPGGATDKPQVSSDIKMRALRRVVSIVAGRVNDRNGSGGSPKPGGDLETKTTADIQETLNEAAAAMPDGWWNVNSHLYSDPAVAHEHLVAQMWFWQVQAFLHLPFLLRPCYDINDGDQQAFDGERTDPYLLNRYLCLQGCREMIRIFTLLRSDPSLAVFICACEDFQGVFCACILMVGTLIRLAFSPPTLPTEHAHIRGDVYEDLAMISEIKDVFRYRALQQSGCISKQGLKVLDELGSFLNDDGAFDYAQPRRRTIVLPYFGAIHLDLTPPAPRHGDLLFVDTQSVCAPADPTPPSSTDQSVTGGIEAAYPDMVNLAMRDWGVDNTSQFVVPDGNMDWDQFIFGNELGQNWEAQLPEWPADESWEWSR